MKKLTHAQCAAEIESAALVAVESTLNEGGFVPPPTLHLVCDRLGSASYAGYIQSRPFHQGEDAHRAIVDLALVASMTAASRLIFAWEQADVQVALRLPGPALPTGLLVMDAPMNGDHVVGWYSAELVQTGTRPDGLPIVAAEWGPVQRIIGGPLPAPATQLLERWRTPRQWSDMELMNTYLDLEDEGYRMRWTQPPDGAPHETWPRWRRVVEAILVAQDQASA
jgi:hypothetical protein